MTHKFILLNGPPRIGKSTTANILAQVLRHAADAAGIDPDYILRRNFADHLKVTTQTAYGYYSTDPDYLDAIKDQVRDEFGGVDFRRLLIDMSEKHLKRLHGKTFFGEMLCRRVETDAPAGAIVLVGDSGFNSEATPVANRFTTDSILLVRLQRPGADFGTDSRGYVYWRNIAAYDEAPAPYQIGPTKFAAAGNLRRELDVDNIEGQQHLAVRAILAQIAEFAPELGSRHDLLAWAEKIMPAPAPQAAPAAG